MTVEDWATAQMMKHGREWTQVQVQQILAKAEVRAIAATAEQKSWSKVAQAGAGGAQGRMEKTLAEVAAQKRYAEQRKVRQAKIHARQYRQKAQRAMAAVQRGKYPEPRGALAETKAKVWEAEAQRRAAALQQQQAQVTMQNTTVDRETAGIVMHKRLMARDRERMAAH